MQIVSFEKKTVKRIENLKSVEIDWLFRIHKQIKLEKFEIPASEKNFRTKLRN